MNDPNPYAPPRCPLSPHEPHDGSERTVAAWARRYMLVGVLIGLIPPLFDFPSTIPPVFIMPVFGTVIGCVFGCLAGTFVRLTKPELPKESVSDDF
jgi:membrane associated rhomboid family serine protease